VQGMLLLYDKLYRSERPDTLNVRDFLPRLVDDIVGVFSTTAAVRTELRIEDFPLGAKVLSPLGIILNEMITNSMKYAFKDAAEGLISVSASRTGRAVRVDYADDGSGLPEAICAESSTGFGLRLIGELVRQIGGTLEIERGRGTRYSIRFEA
jgi:two-component sensor histidine kinase